MAENKVFCAVYGTLRPGDYNSDRFEDGGSAIFHRGFRIPGLLYDGGLPYLDAFAGADHDVVVDIMELEVESERWKHIQYMEIGAGYSAVPVQPIDIETGDPFPHLCIAWHANHAERRGGIVPSGDWKNKPPRSYTFSELLSQPDDDDDNFDEWEGVSDEDLEEELDRVEGGS